MSQVTIPNLSGFTGNPGNNDLFIIHDGSDTKKIRFSQISTKIFSGATSIESDGTQHNLTGSIIPTQNSQYDLGSAEYKVRHLYLSSNSLFLGDTTVSESDYLNRSYLSDTPVPITPNDPGVKGEIRYDSTFVYLCVLENTWKRFTVESAW